MNAHVRINPDVYLLGDLQFIAQLKTANVRQLRAMVDVFTRLGVPFCWKRAACERRLGLNRHQFAWLEQDRWWERPGE